MQRSASFPIPGAARQMHIRIMATSDLHAHILPYDYYSDQPTHRFGLARTASLIRQNRASHPNTLLFDNGDSLNGSPLADVFQQTFAVNCDRDHPVIAAMNALKYDAATLGNHEFDFGLDYLQSVISRAQFPIVSANISARTAHARFTLPEPFIILDRLMADDQGVQWPVRVGVAGFLPRQTGQWNSTQLRDHLALGDILTSARHHIPRIRAAGADIVIALCHSGIGSDVADPEAENVAAALTRIDGLDAVIAGHVHRVFPSADYAVLASADSSTGTINGIPVTQPGQFGSHLGLIDLHLRSGADGWAVAGARGDARPIAARRPQGEAAALTTDDPEITALVQNHHQDTLHHMRRKVGHSSRPLHSFFAMIGCSSSVRLICDAQRAHVSGRLAQTTHAALPLLSAAAPFKSGGQSGPEHYSDVAAGDLALNNLADIYAFPNRIAAVRLSGAQLANWLEMSAAAFATVPVGATDVPLLNPDFAPYNFDLIDGVTYTIDITRPPRFLPDGQLSDAGAGRIFNLCHQGVPVAQTDEFVVATNTYRLSRCNPAAGADYLELVYTAPILVADLINDYVQTARNLDIAPQNYWTFTPMPDTSMILQTTPKAAALMREISHLRPEPIGLNDDGFLQLRIFG